MDLPDELLDEVLRLVPPRHLAACRRVCKSWRGIIDGCGLVLAHLAPGPVRGIFVNLFDKATHSFFSRSGAAWPPIDGSLRFLPGHSPSKGESHVEEGGGHVSGAPAPMNFGRPFLVFDPAVSLHYLAMCFPGVAARPAPPSPPATGDRKKRPRRDRSHVVVSNFSGLYGWPPHSYAVQVFSSRTGRWEERRFVRQGDVVATVSDMWSMNPYAPGHGRVLARVLWGYAAVYWQGAFYLTYRGAFIIRFSLLDDKYQVIKTPQLVDTFLGGPRS
ncbi:hypothetical protein BRADI_2g15601v3 [Brachypodium distachyon]|uniref:F-box domain-containing protein n=1 Tax=Brachypodium distachyon TaxID=15368 RepID=A0A2K2D8S8_BRADI|nr:hypothetical protein BRADI_2g15601v3 [Brachypodium distachyon]